LVRVEIRQSLRRAVQSSYRGCILHCTMKRQDSVRAGLLSITRRDVESGNAIKLD
jgi:hypothetical protein